ncbi:MAG TPA: DNA polymerase III subunit delta [Bdellovibrionales bacterium]|nr:DNA polymerase III subunit delta [Pseudobdellovibrionaceae bacterium]HAG91481.1 DNA polymerase III subunit delta [Bdellovibrionales bacterium]|tara:strand:+ start:113 stop:1111 length:999 start_codon:yes stop_codon:yes gene_type:complete
MVTLDLRKLQQRLEKQNPGNVYVLCGDESFLVEESVNLLKSKIVDEGTMDFNYSSFIAGETSGADVRDAVEMLPMMGARRMVLLRGAESLKEKDWEALYEVIDRPVDSTVFVVACESLDKRKRPYKKLSKASIWVELQRPYENQMPQWIEYLCYRQDLEVSREAIALLLQFVGTNLTELNSEIEKLSSYIGDRNRIEEADVLKVVSRSRVDRIFDLTDAIGVRDKAKALTLLANLLDGGQSEIGVVALLNRHFRILSQLRALAPLGLSGGKLCSKVGIPQFLLNNYLSQSKVWPDRKMTQMFSLLVLTDRALKSSAIAGHVWLENLILKACE